MAKAKPAAKAAKPAKPAKSKASKGSSFDFKAFLLQHGERVGVGSAVALTLLLVLVGLFWPGSGFFAPSATEMADSLNKPAESIEQALRDPNNLPTDADKPPKDSERIDLTTAMVKGDDFRVTGLIIQEGGVQLGRRQPRVLSVIDPAVALARVQVRTYMFKESNPPMVYVLEGGDENKGDGMGKGGPKGGPPGMGGPPPGMGGPPPGMGGGAGGKAGKGNAISDFFTKRKQQKTKDRGLFDPPTDLFKTNLGKKLKAKALDKADANDVYALQTLPLRMAVIAAAFPYRAQVEEFRSKLGMRTNDEVLTEGSMEKDASGNYQYAFRFLGVQVERRELDGDGKPLPGKEGQWDTVRLNEDYKPYVVSAGRAFEPEDPTLAAISFPGLVMPRLPEIQKDDPSTGEGDATPGGGKGGAPLGGAGTGKGPPLGGSGTGKGGPPPMPGGGGKDDKEAAKERTRESQYPAIEKSIGKIKQTLESLKDKDEDVAPPSSKFSADGFDAFSAARGVAPAGDKDKMAPLPPGGKGPSNPANPEAGGKEKELPEYCLVRVVDVTVQPGHTYEYRLKVKMANPNYKRRDTASPTYMTKLELEPAEWSSQPLVLRVEPELRYFAVNQQDVEKLGNPNARFTDRHSKDDKLKPDRAVFLQAHRWIENVRRFGAKGNDSSLPIGEWAVAERMPVYRGEYVGRRERVEVPYWLPNLADFIIATDSSTTKSDPGVNVDFGYNAAGPQPEAILVDFDGGDVSYSRVVGMKNGKPDVKRMPDKSAGEVLMLSPDGTLMLHDVAADAADAERKKRLKEFKTRVRDVKNANKPEDEKEKEKDKKKGGKFGDN